MSYALEPRAGVVLVVLAKSLKATTTDGGSILLGTGNEAMLGFPQAVVDEVDVSDENPVTTFLAAPLNAVAKGAVVESSVAWTPVVRAPVDLSGAAGLERKLGTVGSWDRDLGAGA